MPPLLTLAGVPSALKSLAGLVQELEMFVPPNHPHGAESREWSYLSRAGGGFYPFHLGHLEYGIIPEVLGEAEKQEGREEGRSWER